MHEQKLTAWRASRSGPRMTVSGYDGSKLTKVAVVSIQGPDATRLLWPTSTVGIRPDGTSVELA